MFNDRPLLHTILVIIGLTLTYYLAAKLSFSLVLPPSNASVFWPAAGIALALVLKFGPKILFGVFLGSLIKNIDLYGLDALSSASASLLLFIIIGLSSTLFTYLGFRLIHKYARYPDPLISQHRTLKLLILGGPIAAILPTMITTSALIVSDIISTEVIFSSAFIWWLGDSLGIFIVTPLVLLFIDVQGKKDKNRKWIITIPVMFTLLTIILFWNNINSENERIKNHLTIVDVTQEQQPIELYSSAANPIPDTSFTTDYTTQIDNRIWQIKITPSANDLPNNYSDNVRVVLFINILFTATLTIALLISTGRRVRIEEIVTKRTASLYKAKEDLRLLAITFESHEAIMITDADNKIMRVNQAFTKITGYSQEEVLHKSPDILASGKHSPSFFQNMRQELQKKGSYESEIWNRRKNGEVYPERHTIKTISNGSSKIINYVSVFSDITIQKTHEDHVQYLGFYDQLTSLPNRRLLLDRLQYNLSLSQRNKKRGVLMFLDLDDFKKINDSLGHEVGDELLQQVATRIRQSLSRNDTVARLGGDEFVILVANQTLEDESLIEFSSSLAKKIITAFQQPFHIKGYQHYISTSIGLSIFAPTGQTAVSILGQADTAMYKAKKSGKNTFCFYEQAMQTMAEANLALEHDLRQAIEQQQFILNFQPQVDNLGKTLAIEALLRWHHPERKWVAPSDFIPLAEDSGLIIPIGQWILIQACTQLQSWLQHGIEIQHISINVSPKQFRQADFIDNIKSALNQSGLPAERLMLEITEGIVLDNVDDTIQKMDTLKKIGIQFSIDDFGTGYSSLSYLKRLPIDELKIDQSFVRDIATDKDDAAIVATIIAMATHLNLTVVAEGVENFQQLDFLTDNGCTLFQGYYFSHPLSAADLTSFLHNS